MADDGKSNPGGTGPALPGPGPGRGLTLWARIVGSFLLLALLFGLIVAWGLVRHRRTILDVRLLDEGYLPLALSAAELRATQSILIALLERILDEEDAGATRGWIEAAGRLRPERVRRLADVLDRTATLAVVDGDREAVATLRAEVDALERELSASGEALHGFLAALDARRPDAARDVQAALLEREREVDRRLKAVGREADRKVAALARALERDESRTFWMLLGLALVAAAAAIGILVFVHSTIGALTSLERGVEAVARGDLGARLDIRRNDEIGRIARRFDGMTAAIRERDARLAALRQGEKLAALGRMAAHVSHEVRNPLSAIGLNIELLEEEARRIGAPPRALDLLAAVSREVERLTRVTESYLRLARFPRPEPAPTRIDEVARDAVTFHASEAEARGAALDLHVAGPVPEIRADAAQVRQVLANLLRNALDAVRDSPERRVRVAVRPERGGVEILVADTGPGIPDSVRPRLFEPFFTTKPDGTGIGLVAGQQVALAHGGTLACDPGSGPGACFRLWLPSLPTPEASGIDGPPA